MVVRVAVPHEAVGHVHAQEGGEEAEREVLGDQPLLHREDRLPVPVVAIYGGLRLGEVVEDLRAASRELVLLDVPRCALLVVQEVGVVGVPAQRRAARGDEAVDGLAWLRPGSGSGSGSGSG